MKVACTVMHVTVPLEPNIGAHTIERSTDFVIHLLGHLNVRNSPQQADSIQNVVIGLGVVLTQDLLVDSMKPATNDVLVKVLDGLRSDGHNCRDL